MTDPFRELGDFLRQARSHVEPPRAILPGDGRVRRVPGLRREEVARLAQVSTDYYTRLEQGRRIVPSPQVLAALADALELDESARSHLRHLLDAAGTPASRVPRRYPVPRVRKGLRQLLDTFDRQPALILSHGADVLAANRLAAALFADFDAMRPRQRNYARWLLLAPEARDLFVDWAEQARRTVESLRFAAGNHPGDEALQGLVGELMVASPEFALWWPQHRVHQRTFGSKHLVHPLVGELTVEFESFTLPGDQDQVLYLYTTAPDSASRRALTLLGDWTAPPAAPAEVADPVVAAAESAGAVGQGRPE